MMSKKAIRRRFGLLAALVAALVVASTGIVLAQSSDWNPNPVTTTPSDTTQEAGSGTDTTDSSATSDVSTAAFVSNGDFETGTLSGWTVLTKGQGSWFAYSGTTSPLSAHTIASPPQGNFAATSDETGPGSQVLYQDIKLARHRRHKLSFFLYYQNFASGFITPDSLDINVPNQQYRVDVLKPTADPFSVNPNDILATLFRTNVGDPNTLTPTLKTFSLTRFAGQTVRLRFATVETQNFLLGQVDNVKVKSTRRHHH